MIKTGKQKKIGANYPLLISVFALLISGLVVLYSASTVDSFNNFGNTSHYILHQLFYGAILGMAVMFIFSKIDYHIWQKFLPALLFTSLILLALVKIPGIGFASGGATRWIHLGPITFQPAELAKIVIIFYIASWVDKKHSSLDNLYFDFLPTLVIVGLYSLLILWQPDLGTMITLILIAFAMLFCAGIPWRYLFSSALAGFLAIFALIKFEPYRARRLTTFLNPSLDPKGIGYQINQALLAVGSGSWFGYGYGLSRQKHNYLPEAMTDSIFAVLAEELGFFRSLAVVALFLFFAYQGFRVAKNAPDTFGRMVAFGITSWITFQAAINISAITGLLPLTGIPLPFFSYGSSALVANLAAVGILMNISSFRASTKRI